MELLARRFNEYPYIHITWCFLEETLVFKPEPFLPCASNFCTDICGILCGQYPALIII